MGVSTGNAVSRGQQEGQDAEPYYGEQQEEEGYSSAACMVTKQQLGCSRAPKKFRAAE